MSCAIIDGMSLGVGERLLVMDADFQQDKLQEFASEPPPTAKNHADPPPGRPASCVQVVAACTARRNSSGPAMFSKASRVPPVPTTTMVP